MGRDLMVVYEWIQGGSIPILGPQTSALPVNQSPLYYYMLAPFYLITSGSPFTSLFLNASVYIGLFPFCLFVTRSNKNIHKSVYLIFVLFIFHPQIIAQNRFVWNPSLLPPLIMAAIILFLHFAKEKKDSYLFLSLLFSTIAVSIHYSAIPVMVSILVATFFQYKELRLKTFLFASGCLLAFNLTTLAQIGRRIYLTGTPLRQDEIYQTGSNIYERLMDLVRYAFGIPSFLVGLIFIIAILFMYVKLLSSAKSSNTKTAGFIFFFTVFLTFLSPFNLQAHYVFAITTSLFVFISLLDWKILTITVLFLLFFYLQPKQLISYYKPAPRTYFQMDSCFRTFCAKFKKPIFVSVISSLYPYHYGPEHRYLLMKNGCKVRHIEKDSNAAGHMVVVEDGADLSADTTYYELELFGKNREIASHRCQKNFGIVLLEKKK